MEQLNKDFWWLLDFLGECGYFVSRQQVSSAFRKDLDLYHKMTYLNPVIHTYTEEYCSSPSGECLELHQILERLPQHWISALFGYHESYKAEMEIRYTRYMNSYKKLTSDGN